MIKSIILFVLTIFVIACNQPSKLTKTKPSPAIQDSVRSFMESIARDVNQNGPGVWSRYFENSPDFFMASEGQLVFPNYESADGFVRNSLVKIIKTIELRWSGIRVDLISSDYSCVAATYHEDKTNANGTKESEDGYFTGMAHNQEGKWRLRSMHWSVVNSNSWSVVNPNYKH